MTQVHFLWICVSLNSVPVSFPALMNVSSFSAERNRRHFYSVPKNGKHHFVGLFFIHLGAVRLTAADAFVNICKGGTFRNERLLIHHAQQPKPMETDPMFYTSVFISSLFQWSCRVFPWLRGERCQQLVWVRCSPW